MAQVYMIDSSGKSQPMERIRCKNEDVELQQLLENNYDLLPGDQIDPEDPRRWLLVKREMPVPDPSSGHDRWSIDFLFVDQDAMPTFVECKRCSDTRSRREIVGQMLEYAANGHHYWTSAALRQFAEKVSTDRGSSIETTLKDLLPAETPTPEEFFERVEANLRDGRLRIVFFLEESPFELRSVVDFLNKQLQLSEVLLVEARQYLAGTGRIVLPTLFGFTEQARLAKQAESPGAPGLRKRWNREAFFADAASKLTDMQLTAVANVYDTGVALGCDFGWGTGIRNGSFNVKEPAICQRSLLSIYSNGDLGLNFGWLNDSEVARSARDRLIHLALERLRLPAGDYTERHAVLPIAKWGDRGNDLAEILRTVVEEFRRTRS